MTAAGPACDAVTAPHLSAEAVNLTCLKRFIAAWQRHDIDALMSCVTDDFVYGASVGPEPGLTFTGRESARLGIPWMWAVDAGTESEITEMRVIGDSGVVRWTYRASRNSTDPAMALGCDLVQFTGGLLSRKDAYRKVRQITQRYVEGPHQTAAHAHSRGVGFTVRHATVADAYHLLQLMKSLAEFEGYALRFKVTEQDLIDRGLAPGGLAQFTAIVAEGDMGELWGYALVCEVPYTLDLRPTFVLKELFVAEPARDHKIGSALMAQVVSHARERCGGLLKWDVLPGNERAKHFYRRWGGRPDSAWEAWTLQLA